MCLRVSPSRAVTDVRLMCLRVPPRRAGPDVRLCQDFNKPFEDSRDQIWVKAPLFSLLSLPSLLPLVSLLSLSAPGLHSSFLAPFSQSRRGRHHTWW
eukprot:790335-Rhodomonas_salina.2